MTSTQISSSTKFKKYQLSYTWNIENWSVISSPVQSTSQKEFQSKRFFLKEIDLPCHFFFHCDSKTRTAGKTSGYLIGLCAEKYNPLYKLVQVVKCSVIKDDKPIVDFNVYGNPSTYAVCDKYMISLMGVAHSNVNAEITANDCLSILIEIVYYDYHHTSDLSVAEDSEIEQSDSILKNYHTFYEKQELCDVTFVINDNKIKAHTFVLALASTYFHAMFIQDTKENKDRLVNFSDDPDINSEVFRGFLDFIYNIKKISELKRIALELLILADKFDVKVLQKSCEQYLAKIIDKSNVAKILYLSSKHNCTFLKQRALVVAKSDLTVVTNSVEFSDIHQDKNLITELLLVENNQEN